MLLNFFYRFAVVDVVVVVVAVVVVVVVVKPMKPVKTNNKLTTTNENHGKTNENQ